MNALHEFKEVSGFQINPLKSKLFAAGITQEEMTELMNITHFSEGTFPIKYLGVPLTHGKMKVDQFAQTLDSITDHIKHWSNGSISYAGRLELISSVLQGIHVFWLQAFPMPNMVLEKVNKLCRDFLWAGGRAKVAWQDVRMPKIEGGLGLRNNKIWNTAILTKLLWNIQSNKDFLWIKWVHGYYLKGKNVWEWTTRKNDHPLLKKIEKIINLLLLRTGSVSSVIQLMNKWTVMGVYSVSKAYECLRINGDSKPWMTLIWRTYITPEALFHPMVKHEE